MELCQEHKETMRKARRGRTGWRRRLWARTTQTDILDQIFGKKNLSFTELIFVLIGRLLDWDQNDDVEVWYQSTSGLIYHVEE